MPSVEIDKNTQLCISVSARPGSFGTTVHNEAFKACGLNFVYKSFGVSDIGGAITGIRALGIRGSAVSMPFKETVIKYLDELDETAREIGAVNTIVNEGGTLIGYNTDVYGAQKALEGIPEIASKKVLLLGAGGAAKAVVYALGQLGVRGVIVSNRTSDKAQVLAQKKGYDCVAWAGRSEIHADVIVNTTSVGMHPDVDECPIDEKAVGGCSAVMDIVISPTETLLLRTADRLGKQTLPGHVMCLNQAAMQFELYTKHSAPLDIMEKAVLSLLSA
jgi:shikimate dehydrogenase